MRLLPGGKIMAGGAARAQPKPSDDEIVAAMNGNISGGHVA